MMDEHLNIQQVAQLLNQSIGVESEHFIQKYSWVVLKRIRGFILSSKTDAVMQYSRCVP